MTALRSLSGAKAGPSSSERQINVRYPTFAIRNNGRLRRLNRSALSGATACFTVKTVKECRAAISELIAEAVPENDHGRREGLLTLADGWIALVERRNAADDPPPRGLSEDPKT